MNITSKDEIKLIMKNLNTINQVMKNIRNDKTYTLSNGRAYSPPNNNYDEKDNNKNCGWHYADLKIELPYLDDYTFLVRGDQYYSFYKDHKNDVESIDIVYDKITFNTSVNKYNLILDINSLDCQHDIAKIKNYYNIIANMMTDRSGVPIESELDDLFIEKISNIKSVPVIIVFAEQYKVRFTKKLLPVLNKSSQLRYKLYQLDGMGDNSYFIIEFTTERKELTMVNSYACINY